MQGSAIRLTPRLSRPSGMIEFNGACCKDAAEQEVKQHTTPSVPSATTLVRFLRSLPPAEVHAYRIL